jgi:hypothetical protein
MSGNAFILVITLAAMTACTQGVSNAQDSSFATKGIWEVAGTVALSSYTSVSNGETGDAITIFTFAPQVDRYSAPPRSLHHLSGGRRIDNAHTTLLRAVL